MSSKNETTGKIMDLVQRSNPAELNLSSLSTPAVVKQLVTDILTLAPRKKKVRLNDFYLFLPGAPLDCEIVERLSRSLLDDDIHGAKELWNTYSAELRHEIIIPDAGVLNTELITKLEIEGTEIRNAFLRKHNILPPEKTPYTYTYGLMTAEDATELVLILKQVMSVKPYGKQLIDEFFQEIDLRILYLYGMNEAEQFASDDYDCGANLQLAMDSGDKLPEGVPLLSWLQEHVPSVFARLCTELLNPMWQEDRSCFWESWLRQNRPEARSNHYEIPRAEYRPGKDSLGYEDALDDIFRINETESS